MAESKHTPGPWEATEDIGSLCQIPVVCDGYGEDHTVAMVSNADGSEPGRNGAANACLIAAAPTLYRETLVTGIDLASWLERDDLPDGLRAELVARLEWNHAAIAQARGEDY